MLNANAINSIPINGTGVVSGRLNLALKVEVTQPKLIGQAAVNLKITNFQCSQLRLPLLVSKHYPKAKIGLSLKVRKYAHSAIGIPLSISVYEQAAFKQQSSLWNIRLLLDDLDVSSNLTDSLRIEEEEGTAKIAEFTLVPFSGPISLTKWLGKSVFIYFCTDLSEVLTFQGVVDEPVYDPTSRLTKFVCTDQLQQQLESLTQNQVNALIKGHWTNLVFEAKDDMWQYAQDLLSTIPASLDIDRRNTLRVTPWKGKQTPDFEFAEDDILYQSIEVQLANRREIHNQTDITVQYRYPRLKQREILYEYRYPYSFCEQNFKNSTLPNVEMIGQAIEGTGWLLKDEVQYIHQRGPGWVSCGGVTFGYLISEELQKFLVREARFVLAKRFVQTVTENINLSIQAQQSIDRIGQISNHESLNYEVHPEDEHFTDISKYVVPPDGRALDLQGDYVVDSDDRHEFNQMVITKLNQARTSILKSHRNNLVSFRTPLNPFIERHHTMKLDSTNVIAQGKVKHVIHECNFNEGSCLSSITMAVSRTDSDSGLVEDGLSPPSKISSFEKGGMSKRITLSTHLGGRIDSAAYDEKWDGYTGNEQLQIGAQAYPERFVVSTPAIEEEQAPIQYQANFTYRIRVPNELLLLSA